MSLLWHDRLQVAFMPDHVSIRHQPRGFARHAEVRNEPLTAAASDGTATIAALRDCLATWQIKAARIDVILSHHFVRFAVMPAGKLTDDTQSKQLAKIVMRNTYGPVADQWEVCGEPVRTDSTSLACGIDRELLESLHQVCGSHGRLVSVRPIWMDVVNRFHRQMSAFDGCLVVAEHGRLTLGWLRNRQWSDITGRFVLEDEAEHTLLEHIALANEARGGYLWLCDLTGRLRVDSPPPWNLVNLLANEDLRSASDVILAWN